MKSETKIIYHEEQNVFHLYNEEVSYIMMLLPDGELGQLYFGQRIHDKEDFSYLLELAPRPMSSCVFPEANLFSGADQAGTSNLWQFGLSHACRRYIAAGWQPYPGSSI